MEKPVKMLKEWAIAFLKNKDLIFKKIKEIEDHEGAPGFTVHYKDRTQKAFCVAHLDEGALKKIKDEQIGLFVFHTKSSFKFMMDNWKEFTKFPHLTIYFVNPYLHVENKWILQPHNHDKIADSASFKTGMNSMFAMVEPVREEDLKSGKHF